mgnify:FL=1
MLGYKKIINLQIILTFFLFSNVCYADNHNLKEILELIQKDLKTLEKAVYSGSINIGDNSETLGSTTSLDHNSEDVLTRHLLKLSEIESQFQQLTNKFEEMNFKLDKLSNRLSKVQADNQIRFRDIENVISSVDGNNLQSFNKKKDLEKDLPGSSQPQDLGSITYKDTDNNESIQQTQSVTSTATIVTENFQSEEKILPEETPEKQYDFATSFLKVGD